MSDIHTDLVIQISASDSDTEGEPVARGADHPLIMELTHCLRPGVEIALVFEGFMAMTSILWLSDLQPDGSVRAGIRLLGVSALPSEKREGPSAWNESAGGGVSVPVEALPMIRHQL